MSEWRDADKDREQLIEYMSSSPDTAPIYSIIFHYLERAVAAEAEVERLRGTLEGTVHIANLTQMDLHDSREKMKRIDAARMDAEQRVSELEKIHNQRLGG